MSKKAPLQEHAPPLKGSIQFKAVVEILRAADRVKTCTAQLITPFGLTLSQYNALRILRGAPDGLSTMEVCQRLLERSPGITRIIDGLAKKGLVRRTSHPKDRRSILCSITEEGLELVAGLDEPVDLSDRDLLQDLSEAEVMQLAELLTRVGKNGT